MNSSTLLVGLILLVAIPTKGEWITNSTCDWINDTRAGHPRCFSWVKPKPVKKPKHDQTR